MIITPERRRMQTDTDYDASRVETLNVKNPRGRGQQGLKIEYRKRSQAFLRIRTNANVPAVPKAITIRPSAPGSGITMYSTSANI